MTAEEARAILSSAQRFTVYPVSLRKKSDPVRSLAAAVILQAVKDALSELRNGKCTTFEWLAYSPAVEGWAEVAGIDFRRIREWAMAILGGKAAGGSARGQAR